MDVARGADREEQRAIGDGLIDPVHLQRYFAEPDDIGPHGADLLATRAGRVEAEVVLPRRDPGTRAAPGLEHLAMHVDEVRCSGALMQIVDVLGHHQDLVRPVLLEPGKGEMGGVRRHVAGQEPLAAGIVEGVDPFR